MCSTLRVSHVVQTQGPLPGEALQKFGVFTGAIGGAVKAGQEVNDSRRDHVGSADLDRGFFGAVPITVSGDEPPGDFDPRNVCEGVQLFGLCGVVHGWNKNWIFWKVGRSAVGIDLISELARCPRHRVINNCGVHVVAVVDRRLGEDGALRSRRSLRIIIEEGTDSVSSSGPAVTHKD